MRDAIPQNLKDSEIEIEKRTYFVAVLFFFSGFSSLIYQVVWSRQLSLFYGSDVYSASITLSSFMGGLSIGSWIASKLVDRIKNTLFWYGILEILIGFYALFFNHILHSFFNLNQWSYNHFFNTTPWIYQVIRIIVGCLTLLLPTSLMGGTLPLIIKHFAKKLNIIGWTSGFFYSINTLGALFGVLVSGFVLLPWLGVKTTTQITFVINIVIGLTMISLRNPIKVTGLTMQLNELPNSFFHSPMKKIAMIGIFFSGMAGMALEVVWMRILIQSFSATIYSYSVMLSCFLLGIFYGSKKASALMDNCQNPTKFFGFLELGLGISVAILGVLTYIVPSAFGILLWSRIGISKGGFAVSCVITQFFISMFLIGGPAMLLGETFPTSVKMAVLDMRLTGHGTGRIYAANTVGAVLGALLAGFIFIPVFGRRASLLVIFLVFLGNSIFLFYKGDGDLLSFLKKKKGGVVFGVVILVLMSGFTLLPHQIIINFNLQRSENLEVIFHSEGVSHTIDIVRNNLKQIIMMVNGNIEADTTYNQKRHFILKGHLPLLLHPNPKKVAIVGLGLGITLTATARYPTVERIKLIELSPEVIESNRYLKPFIGSALSSPKVEVVIDDARNFFSMADEKFDVITADPIHPRISGTGYLYTKEYYELIKSKLNHGGVVCQWMPMYQISGKSFDVAFRTFASVFPNASFWYVRGHGLFVATQQPFEVDYKNIQKRLNRKPIKEDLESIGIVGMEGLFKHLFMGREEIEKYLSSIIDTTINTDNNSYLEYHVPFEFLDSTEKIVEKLLPFSGFDHKLIPNLPEEEKRSLLREWQKRQLKILPELKESLQ